MEGRETRLYDLDQYDYQLPPELIAQAPSGRREESRLLVLDRSGNRLEHRHFADLPRFLRAGDMLVVNDTRVVGARLRGCKPTGGKVELLVLDPYKAPELGAREGYECLVKAAKRSAPGTLIDLGNNIRAEILSSGGNGKAQVRFLSDRPLLDLLQQIGEVPLPPYIDRRAGECPVDDTTAYQTVYAQHPGAVAAPTAGLHFSEQLLQRLGERGVEVVPVTLHVGYGTFAPIRVEDIREHRMHSEYACIDAAAAARIAGAQAEGRRIIAVGTTVVRILEWTALQCGGITPFAGFCTHYIYPGYRFRVVDAMITNFHLPKSTLLLLVSAFAGREAILNAYREAVVKAYRFFSYGDAMFIT